MRKLLLVVDFQNDFVTGSLGTPWAQEVSPRIKEKIIEHYDYSIDIIFTRDTHTDEYLGTHEGINLPIPHCIYGTDGWKIVDGLDRFAYAVYNKYSFGLTAGNLLLGDCTYGRLACKYDEIEIIGLCTDICVISNALMLRSIFPEVEIIVDASCCAGTSRALHESALNVMESCQIKVVNRE